MRRSCSCGSILYRQINVRYNLFQWLLLIICIVLSGAQDGQIDNDDNSAPSPTSPSFIVSNFTVTTLSPTVSRIPTNQPSLRPSSKPTNAPSSHPTPSPPPTPAPTNIHSSHPSVSLLPTSSQLPSYEPSKSNIPTTVPSMKPSLSLLPSASIMPSTQPSGSMVPSVLPSSSMIPSSGPSMAPSSAPSTFPTAVPSISMIPSLAPSSGPTIKPSSTPSTTPSKMPSLAPSAEPSLSLFPSLEPTLSEMPSLSMEPSLSQIPSLSIAPSGQPTIAPSSVPSISSRPSSLPSDEPSLTPTLSSQPSYSPSVSMQPSLSSIPSNVPSAMPSFLPSALPSVVPTTSFPSSIPSTMPSQVPSTVPSSMPSDSPSQAPTITLITVHEPRIVMVLEDLNQEWNNRHETRWEELTSNHVTRFWRRIHGELPHLIPVVIIEINTHLLRRKLEVYPARQQFQQPGSLLTLEYEQTITYGILSREQHNSFNPQDLFSLPFHLDLQTYVVDLTNVFRVGSLIRLDSLELLEITTPPSSSPSGLPSQEPSTSRPSDAPSLRPSHAPVIIVPIEDPESNNKDDGLSRGAVAAIAFLVVVAALSIAAVVVWVHYKKHEENDTNNDGLGEEEIIVYDTPESVSYNATNGTGTGTGSNWMGSYGSRTTTESRLTTSSIGLNTTTDSSQVKPKVRSLSDADQSFLSEIRLHKTPDENFPILPPLNHEAPIRESVDSSTDDNHGSDVIRIGSGSPKYPFTPVSPLHIPDDNSASYYSTDSPLPQDRPHYGEPAYVPSMSNFNLKIEELE